MEQKRKNIKTKSKSTRSRRTVRRKKPKINISVEKCIILFAIIASACTVLLFFSEILNSLKENHSQSDENTPIIREEIHRPEQIDEKIEDKNAGILSEKKENAHIKKTEQKKSYDTNSSSSIEADKKNSAKKDISSKAENIPSEFEFLPEAVNEAKLVFLFDDGGQNLSHLDKFLSLPFPITVAVLPGLVHSAESGRRVRESGNELMLHQPMQAVNRNVNPGPGAITPDMSLLDIDLLLAKNIEEIGPVAGVNNHEGSLISEDELRIGQVMQTLASRNLFYLDSRTTSQTRVPQAAMSLGLSYYERNIFLDNIKTRSNVIEEIKKSLVIANKNGSVIMIGHVWAADFLPDVLLELYPVFVRKGYKFATVSKSGALITP